MSLKALPIPPVPEETARVAHAAFPRGNLFMQARDTLGTIYIDDAKARPVSNPWATRSGTLAFGPGDDFSISGRLDRSPDR